MKTRRKENLKAVTGTVRWIRSLIVGKQLGRLSITNANGKATEYDLGAFTDNAGIVTGYGLAKDDDEVYSIDVSSGHGWTCDCGDCQFRNRECKHIKAVRAALNQAAIRAEDEENNIETCGFCSGHGWTYASMYDNHGYQRYDEPPQVACEYCGGSGMIEDGHLLMPAYPREYYER